jgi:hypothetical protein
VGLRLPGKLALHPGVPVIDFSPLRKKFSPLTILVLPRYSRQSEESGYRFKPFGIEVYGAWGPSAVQLLNELTEHSLSLGANDTRLVAGWSAPHWQELVRQRVSVALQRGNVLLLKLAAERRRHRAAAHPESWYMGDDDAPDRPTVSVANLEGTRLLHADRAQAAQRASVALSQRIEVWRPPPPQQTAA